MRYSNHFKCLLCYLICFALPLVWQTLALWLIYPNQLAGTAPNVLQNLADAFPFLKELLHPALLLTTMPASFQPDALAAALAHQDGYWRQFIMLFSCAAWAVTLAMQLIWRFTHSASLMTARATQRAIFTYRLFQMGIWLCNGLLAGLLWFLGVRFIPGRTLWDYWVYFAVYPMNIIAAFLCFRLAAPPTLSGKHAFFKRL